MLSFGLIDTTIRVMLLQAYHPQGYPMQQGGATQGQLVARPQFNHMPPAPAQQVFAGGGVSVDCVDMSNTHIPTLELYSRCRLRLLGLLIGLVLSFCEC